MLGGCRAITRIDENLTEPGEGQELIQLATCSVQMDPAAPPAGRQRQARQRIHGHRIGADRADLQFQDPAPRVTERHATAGIQARQVGAGEGRTDCDGWPPEVHSE
jgi:hypothetical protein